MGVRHSKANGGEVADAVRGDDFTAVLDRRRLEVLQLLVRFDFSPEPKIDPGRGRVDVEDLDGVRAPDGICLLST